MSQLYFNPGCALMLYKPHLAQKLLRTLSDHIGEVRLHEVCCHYDPKLEPGARIINVCPGCDRRFGNLYDGISTVSLWEVFDGLDSFSLPDYSGETISVHDACPVRGRPQVHRAVRNLLKKMNFEIVETPLHGEQSICCSDSFYPSLPVEQVQQQMKKRADSMPCENVCVYCVSCVKSMHIGGKTPRYLVDLLMGEGTQAQETDTVKWHEQVKEYQESHQG